MGGAGPEGGVTKILSGGFGGGLVMDGSSRMMRGGGCLAVSSADAAPININAKVEAAYAKRTAALPLCNTACATVGVVSQIIARLDVSVARPLTLPFRLQSIHPRHTLPLDSSDTPPETKAGGLPPHSEIDRCFALMPINYSRTSWKREC